MFLESFMGLQCQGLYRPHPPQSHSPGALRSPSLNTEREDLCLAAAPPHAVPPPHGASYPAAVPLFHAAVLPFPRPASNPQRYCPLPRRMPCACLTLGRRGPRRTASWMRC